jgi:hypothetical protein
MAEEIKGDSRILLYGRMDTVIAIALGKGHVHACVRVEDLKVIAEFRLRLSRLLKSILA